MNKIYTRKNSINYFTNFYLKHPIYINYHGLQSNDAKRIR